ncbi:hypothetical protein [Sphingomonas sp. 28-63-12]|uniref:hypothetical protein n=1 Tax=Sphingomonas sp. 28-63-12 TaxID=1970434 RepID=UPI0035A830B7
MTRLYALATASMLAVSSLAFAAAPASAAPCRDSHGKFIKCAVTALPAKPVPTRAAVCHDAHGKFAKCPAVAGKVEVAKTVIVTHRAVSTKKVVAAKTIATKPIVKPAAKPMAKS